MKEAKRTGISSLIQGPEYTGQGLPHVGNDLLSSRISPLHVSIKKRETEMSPQLAQLPEEEHSHRLMSLGEKVGHLAHDIRNPLSSIEWFATLLGRDHHSQDERKELAEQCVQAVRSLDHLVSNLLIFSAPLDASQEPVDLHALLDAVELLAMYPLRKKRLVIHRHQDERLRHITGHESLLKHMLLNLLTNAIHASKHGSSIEIYCGIHSRLVTRNETPCVSQGIVLRICDEGCGMSQEELSQIFRPFYSKRKGGTGLGLSIVKQIVHIHHGLIDITSQEGKGTTVELFFP